MLTIQLADLDTLHKLFGDLTTLHYLHTLADTAHPMTQHDVWQHHEAEAYLWDRVDQTLSEMRDALFRPDFTVSIPEPPQN